MNEPEEAPVAERRSSAAGWGAACELMLIVVFAATSAYVSNNLPDRSDDPRTLSSMALLLISGAATLFNLVRKMHCEIAPVYESILRSIDKSKANTRTRTATSTAIDAVAHRIHANRTSASVILTAALFLALLLRLRWEHAAPPALVILLIAAIVVLNVSTLAFDYRVSRGLFGTNEHEAREIVRFVIRNASNDDFSDGLGARDLDITGRTQRELTLIWSGEPAYE